MAYIEVKNACKKYVQNGAETVFLADRIVIMMANPRRIKSIIKVPLGNYHNRTSSNFLYVRDKVFELFNMKTEEYIEYIIQGEYYEQTQSQT